MDRLSASTSLLLLYSKSHKPALTVRGINSSGQTAEYSNLYLRLSALSAKEAVAVFLYFFVPCQKLHFKFPS
ncbi:hypothetical protein BpHYR1_036045 [Brachionus plicatilis]|uniref:Uncharacterized protein n=1 Tax=Brachionus plicatilis TaxID=10195 RepID=A0A3M7RZ97_BRAPC|nr:hypothetical protein BpHYR1_036045 [Brachionus plicatilis]